jgi:hypothetical protein
MLRNAKGRLVDSGRKRDVGLRELERLKGKLAVVESTREVPSGAPLTEKIGSGPWKWPPRSE